MDIIINEIFSGIEGETTRAGFPALFIRLTGCNLNCVYCDTEDAKLEGKKIPIQSIISAISKIEHIDHITITGGEPLCQNSSIVLMETLINLKLNVQIETNGSISLEKVPSHVRKIVDVKTPSSGEEKSFLFQNLTYLEAEDEIKFIISDMNDYRFAKEFTNSYLKNTKAVINFSPAFGTMESSQLGDLIIDDKLSVRLNLQLHKTVWSGKSESKITIDPFSE